METYPDIVRRDGTLFFACADNDRAAISTSIERLIDLLDALDGDPDLEPYMADTQGVGGVGSADDREGDDADLEPSCGWSASEAAYGIYDGPVSGEEEEEDPSGFGDFEALLEDTSGEPSLGWTNHIDQTKALMTHNVWHAEDGEPDLGWCGNATGWTVGEGTADAEPNGDEGDYSGFTDESPWVGFEYDGSGEAEANEMIRGLTRAAARAKAYQALGVFPLVYDFRGMAR